MIDLALVFVAALSLAIALAVVIQMARRPISPPDRAKPDRPTRKTPQITYHGSLSSSDCWISFWGWPDPWGPTTWTVDDPMDTLADTTEARGWTENGGTK